MFYLMIDQSCLSTNASVLSGDVGRMNAKMENDEICFKFSSSGRLSINDNKCVELDSGKDTRIDWSSLSLSESRSCPKLIDLDKGADISQQGSKSKSSKSRKLKSHPISQTENDTYAKNKGVSIVKLIKVIGGGLGCTIYYCAWKFKILRCTPSVIGSFCIGTYAGIRYCRNYHNNCKRKCVNGKILSMDARESGCSQGGSKSSSRFNLRCMVSTSEKVEYITRVLKLMWPVYEPNICDWIIRFLTPTLDELKPQIIKKIYFSNLTFGSIPFDITEVRVIKESSEEFVIDAGVRWHGNAHVAITVDLRGGGTLTPKFQKFYFYGNARISFTPLIPKFPGFGAITLCLHSAPNIDFELSVDQPVLSMVAEQVRQFLSTFVTDHVFGNVLVWPARVVIPVLPERLRGNLDHLQLHTRGVLRVVVVEAFGLALGERFNSFKANIKPFVVLETITLQPIATKVLPDGQLPIWNEEHFLKVQEMDQHLNVEIFDDHYDPVLSAFSKLKRHGRKIGGVSIPLKQLKPGELLDCWHCLAENEENVSRAVRTKHYGQDMLSETWYLDKKRSSGIRIRLCLTYMPVEDLRQGKLMLSTRQAGASVMSHRGLLFVRLLRAYNLANVDFLSLSDPFCQLTVGCAVPKRSKTIKNTLDPRWGESFEWFNVSVKENLCIEVFSEGKVMDTPLGFVLIDILAIAAKCEKEARVLDATITLTHGVGDIHLEIEWVPLDKNYVKKSKLKYPTPFSAPELQTIPRGQLFVRLLWAIGLDNVEYIGRSNPYCILKVQGNERKSIVVWDNLNPRWDEEFWWESVKHTDVLQIEVWAKGTLQDTFLAKVFMQIKQLIDREGLIKEQSQPVRRRDSSQHGVLNFQVLWKLSEDKCKNRAPFTFASWPDPLASPPPNNSRRSFGNIFYSA